ncbi:MAG TPA: hypothetical protein PLU43_11720, partial [Lachnospiraceae bacterium]|nr:hypothetical protein [Lachnospiraceae bacterium]
MKKVVEWIRNLKMISKIRIIIVWLSVFIVLIGAIVYFSLGKIGIGGKDYDEIIMGKDLTADILPPPEYVVESYLTAMEYVMTEDETVREEKVEYIAELKEEYNERHEYWISCQEQGLLSDE